MSLTTAIPGSSASPSKMQKKGWKCWAKALSDVKAPAKNGYDFEGSFLSPGRATNLEAGDVILHADDSSEYAVGVVLASSQGGGTIAWTDSDSGGSWALALSRAARKLLDMPVDERIRFAAKDMLERESIQSDPTKVAYYRKMAGLDEVAPQQNGREQAISEIRRLMSEHDISASDLS